MSKRWEPLPEGLHVIDDAFGDEHMEASIGGSLLTIPNETSSIQLDPDSYRLCRQVDSAPMVEMTEARRDALQRICDWIDSEFGAGMIEQASIVRAMLKEVEDDQ